MKKEIKKLLTLGNTRKSLQLNGTFELVADYLDENGRNVEVSKKKPVDMTLSLVYVLAHDKCLFISRSIKSRTYTEIIDEIARAMEEIYSQISSELVREFRAGHLLGKVKTIYKENYYE